MWTSSLFKTYTVKRWTVRNTDGNWENCAGFIYIENRLRCVFHGGDISTSNKNIESESESECKIYPNPAMDQFKILVPGNGFVEILICDIDGRMIKQIHDYKNNSNINTDDLSPGMYFVRVQSGVKTEDLKVILYQ